MTAGSSTPDRQPALPRALLVLLGAAALVFWGWAIGALGILLAVPLTLLVKALLADADPDSRWISALVSAEPPASPKVEVSKGNEVS